MRSGDAQVGFGRAKPKSPSPKPRRSSFLFYALFALLLGTNAVTGIALYYAPEINDLLREDNSAIIGVNRGCFAAFKAVYECEVPVVSAVNDFCVGGGIGLVGNSDIIVASEGSVFGLPEIDRGALGAATHLSRMVPVHKMRAMFFLCENATAEELHEYGSVYAVVPREELRDKAMEIAGRLGEKNGTVLRAAKEALNGIDLWDVNKSYRYEQGFTMELNLSGVAHEVRDTFGK